jgi:hypothetical protein
MKRSVVFLFVSMVFLAGIRAANPSHSYVGVKQCAPCHRTEKQGKQVPIWEGSKHSKAFQTLKTAQAQEVAKKAGVKVAAHEAPECLRCHVTGVGVPATALKPTFVKDDGVQCETCHGPGSDYKTMAIMRDRAKAVAAGMIPILVADGSAEKQCRSCHNPESPTFKGFNFKEDWAKIAHPTPPPAK